MNIILVSKKYQKVELIKSKTIKTCFELLEIINKKLPHHTFCLLFVTHLTSQQPKQMVWNILQTNNLKDMNMLSKRVLK